jgi:D-glycero-D-manno-heptose 1,7-bisphosphate phosphatase
LNKEKHNLTLSSIQYVFLDRDGVLNRKQPEGHYVTRWSEFELLPGVEEALVRLKASGRTLIVVSNQRGVALGLYTEQDVETIHHRLNEHLAKHNAQIDGFYFCPHDKNQCECRKPKTGLFQKALRDFPGANASNSIVIGDSISDIEAANTLGWPSIFIHGEADRQKPGASLAASKATGQANSLLEAVAGFL